MAIIPILQYPEKRLYTKGTTVTDFGPETQKIIDDMFETLYNAENCAALAMTQLDYEHPMRITVIDFSANKDNPLCLVNPEYFPLTDEKFNEAEGCMSVPGGVYENVGRPRKVLVKAQDRHGEPVEFEAEDFMAKCVQHETDHLNGSLFIDRLSKLKRQRAEMRIKKHHRWASKRKAEG